MSSRLFLVAPDSADPKILSACLTEAASAGDIASLLLPAGLVPILGKQAQNHGIAVLVDTADEPNLPSSCDGIQINHLQTDLAHLRKKLGADAIIGFYAKNSRHAALQAAEMGADYIAFSQNLPPPFDEPLIDWWAQFCEIPVVAFDEVELADLPDLMQQRPDFVRPSDAIWSSPAQAKNIISAFTDFFAKSSPKKLQTS